ncbi:hypothetical protein BRD13_04465 [Halobacteriales archaeon SW_5_70_135]|nr:MAG: hypothetical protein BRD13_04465 [Halobacteriales archaeon SW_5_70_135]
MYAARFVGDTAYLVTFRRVDPFHVVDLSAPEKSTELGAVELPGFSRYLHPVGEDRVLGVDREDGDVRAVVFDVSDPADPTVVDDVVLDDWSAIERTHHAFLNDPRHEVVFVPGADGGHVLGYDTAAGDAALDYETTVDVDGRAVRAVYVDDHLHVYGTDEVTVVDERDWERVTTLTLDVSPDEQPLRGGRRPDTYLPAGRHGSRMAVLTEDDEGKFLMDAEGEQIGIVTEVDDGVAYVEPDPDVGEALIQSLGFGDADEDDIEVHGDAVETVTESELRLRGEL